MEFIRKIRQSGNSKTITIPKEANLEIGKAYQFSVKKLKLEEEKENGKKP